MISLISTVVTLNSKLQKGIEESASRASRILSEASQPPILSLYSFNKALYVEILTSRPLELKGFLVELPNSVFYKPVDNVTIGVSRFKIVDGYNCEPVRVHLLLSSGLIVSYDPRLDPRVGSTPKGWDGWWRCGLSEEGGRSVYDPKVWLEVLGLGGGRNDTRVLGVQWGAWISATIRVGASMDLGGYTWGDCSVFNPRVGRWGSEALVGSFSIEDSRVDVILGCISGWPVAVYLTLRGPQDVVYNGRVDFNYRVTYRTHTPPIDASKDPSLEGPLPVAYTPLGSSSYTARRSFWIPTTTTVEWTYEGSATINYRMSSTLVLLTWAYLRPDPFIGVYNRDNPYVYVNLNVYVKVDNATKVEIQPVMIDLGVLDAVRVRLYSYNLTSPAITRDREPALIREQVTLCTPIYDSGRLTGYECKPSEKIYVKMVEGVVIPEPFSHAIYNVYQKLLPRAPRVEIVVNTVDFEYRRFVEPGGATEVSFPASRMRLEVKPYAHPPLCNGLSTSYRDVDERVREYTGKTELAPNPSPWRGPALVEIEMPKGRFLVALSWPGVLAVTQANITYKGYAQLIGDKPYTITPNTGYRVAKAYVDSLTLMVTVEQTIDSRRGWIADLSSFKGSHVIVTIASRNPHEVESIIAWIS